ncbi:uncharacterized protein TNCV_217151 [Trichonephila clavipes]|nr:uncharacterized protein TNCV_217151 [Trichonephila clavipes]
MPQRYAVEMHDEFVLKGNTAVLKCHVPGFVKDYVIVEAWIKEPMEKVDATSKSSLSRPPRGGRPIVSEALICTDGSKDESNRTGSGAFIEKLSIRLSRRNPKTAQSSEMN